MKVGNSTAPLFPASPRRTAHRNAPLTHRCRSTIKTFTLKLWSESVSEVQLAGIPVEDLRKGDYFTPDQVEHAYRKINDKLDEQIERFNRGELRSDPRDFAPTKVIEFIHKMRDEIGKPVVCRSENGGVRVLTDAEAVIYLNSQANAGLRKHKAKTTQMLTAIDASTLNEHQRRELDANQRKHAFILASHQGARTQSLRMQRKGLCLPDFSKDLGDKQK